MAITQFKISQMDLDLFYGRERETIGLCIERLAEATNSSAESVFESILDSFHIPSLTEEDIKNRNYTYVSAGIHEKFLVPSPRMKEARRLAGLYVKDTGLQISSRRGLDFYPKNYVRESMKLWKEGKYYDPNRVKPPALEPPAQSLPDEK